MSGYQTLIKMIVDGELVTAGVTNRAPSALQGNIDYLKEILEEAFAGQTLVARDRTIDPEANIGQAVYYNPLSQRYEQALATTFNDPLTGTLLMAPSTFTWGIVKRKLAADKGDILLHGVAEIDMSAAIVGSPNPGMYFLSGVQPGFLVSQQPPVSIPVALLAGPGILSGTTTVFVNTNLRDMLEGHRHYKVPLLCCPAGTPTTYEDADRLRQGVLNPDPTVEGWLPATPEFFPDAAIPRGARFGYNIAASKLINLWPPIPVDGAYLEWNKGESTDLLGMGVPLGDTELAVINSTGIWWLSDCQDDVPWPMGLTTDTPMSESIAHHECPRDTYMMLTLWFTRPIFANNQSCVLSLTPRAGSGLTTYCTGTDTPANVGNLDIDFDLQLLIGATNIPGWLAMKTITGKQFNLGPVVEKIQAGTSNVTITGVPNQSIADDEGFQAGQLTISVQDSLNGLELPVETVRLAGAYEVFPYDVIGLGFDYGKDSTFYGRIGVRAWPTLPVGTQMKLQFWVLARTAGAIPDAVFSATYRSIPMPSATLTPLDLPLTDTDLTLDTAVTVDTDQYVLMETEPFDVASGDTVMFSITRSSTDVYDGELDVIRKYGVLIVPGN
jgi:hypothetical protein